MFYILDIDTSTAIRLLMYKFVPLGCSPSLVASSVLILVLSMGRRKREEEWHSEMDTWAAIEVRNSRYWNGVCIGPSFSSLRFSTTPHSTASLSLERLPRPLLLHFSRLLLCLTSSILFRTYPLTISGILPAPRVRPPHGRKQGLSKQMGAL